MRRQKAAKERANEIESPLGRRYLLHERIGRGAMGEVFRATVRGTGEPFAAKILVPSLSCDPELVARFLREWAILTSLSDPGLVRVHDLVAEGETLAIVMDLVEGEDLRSYLSSTGRLSPGEAARIGAEVLAGLAVVHAAGVVHRDVKPENVLLDRTQSPFRARLADFGIARIAAGPSLTELPGLIGTPAYLAPELDDHTPATFAADVYAVGVMLRELVTARTPVPRTSTTSVPRFHGGDDPDRPDGLPGPLHDVIEALTASDPAARPSAAEASTLLAALGTGDSASSSAEVRKTVSVSKETIVPHLRHVVVDDDDEVVHHSHRALLAAIGGGVAAVIVAGLLVVLVFHHSRPGPTPRPGSPPVASAGRLVDLINQTRASKGLPALLVNQQIAGVASALAAQLAPTGTDDASTLRPKVVTQLTPLFPNSDAVGFNVALEASTADQAYKAELNTPQFLQNFVDPTFSYIGIGIARTTDGLFYILEIFVAPGSPAPSGSQPPSTTSPP